MPQQLIAGQIFRIGSCSADNAARRWVVERTFAWLGRNRRLAKDWEKSIESSTAWATIAHIRILTRRLGRYCYA